MSLADNDGNWTDGFIGAYAPDIESGGEKIGRECECRWQGGVVRAGEVFTCQGEAFSRTIPLIEVADCLPNAVFPFDGSRNRDERRNWLDTIDRQVLPDSARTRLAIFENNL